ncbi:hypothetical protein CDD80_2234 [Ophiocordyceps camponoti-rufipedis]|uniref:Translin n=1 Tax=Ophiocordyceps camponoti-rufipedis TaxID=2004952 RepID=A0A2C5XTS2_9HYPO|nr:hypothetical protein CDD80_2234 [Ophiocordyceps camponoti-rufipedis]
MATGTKRDHSGNPRAEAGPSGGQFHAMFERFRDELDEHHDRRERVVKASRDVTAQSKKITETLNEPLPPSIAQEVEKRMSSITKLLTDIAPDLAPPHRHRYAWQMRGLEELIEALSFGHYLETQSLMTPQEAQAAVPAPIPLTTDDYLLGVMDLFGELMRFATVRRGLVVGERSVLADLQGWARAFEALPRGHSRDWVAKLEAMRQSVRKVEDLGYGLVVRGSERPGGWVPDGKDEEGQLA